MAERSAAAVKRIAKALYPTDARKLIGNPQGQHVAFLLSDASANLRKAVYEGRRSRGKRAAYQRQALADVEAAMAVLFSGYMAT